MFRVIQIINTAIRYSWIHCLIFGHYYEWMINLVDDFSLWRCERCGKLEVVD